MPDELDYEGIVEIEEDALDRECVRQPRLYMKYALQLAEAQQVLAEKKAAHELARAEVALDIRTDPASYTTVKVTEAVVDALVEANKRVRKALADYIQAKREVDNLKVVVDALEHKKRMIENLVTLHGQNYYSAPRTTKEGEEKLSGARKARLQNRRQNGRG